MSKEYAPHRLPSGTVLQAGIPTRPAPAVAYRASGILMRGVVTATYVADDPNHPSETNGNSAVAVYCDVLAFSSRSGQRWTFLPQALVLQDRGAMHSGRIWKPRAATKDITGEPLNINRATLPANMDGDWVLVGFLDDAPNQPVILGGIPHPSADAGNEGKTAGHRMKLKLADGDPDFWKHKGAFYGIDKDGNFTVDTTEAYATDLASDGKEPAAPGNGTAGNVKVKLPVGSSLHVQLDGGELLKLEFKGTTAKLTLGDGSKHATIYEALEDFWNNTVKPKFDTFDTHVHPTGVGPSGAPSVLVALPAMATAAKSTKVNIPDA